MAASACTTASQKTCPAGKKTQRVSFVAVGAGMEQIRSDTRISPAPWMSRSVRLAKEICGLRHAKLEVKKNCSAESDHDHLVHAKDPTRRPGRPL